MRRVQNDVGGGRCRSCSLLVDVLSSVACPLRKGTARWRGCLQLLLLATKVPATTTSIGVVVGGVVLMLFSCH